MRDVELVLAEFESTSDPRERKPFDVSAMARAIVDLRQKQKALRSQLHRGGVSAAHVLTVLHRILRGDLGVQGLCIEPGDGWGKCEAEASSMAIRISLSKIESVARYHGVQLDTEGDTINQPSQAVRMLRVWAFEQARTGKEPHTYTARILREYADVIEKEIG